ncbi:antitoxin Xre/MbcA/ParS toxin-binding domain-containing protein [Pseudomonas sp. CR3202]|uniref:antitoxin Xre/MbcA/ParS toxin-binding domain-containing protein n=1 Tax=Pseudomonas sp. CR3202 TaxID=3351532 RepID=UPI003BF44E2A
MNEFNERKLSSRFASLLSGRPGHNIELFGFECLDGWSDLIEATLEIVRTYAEHQDIEVRVVQVKEKFGQLRIYQRGGDECVDTALHIAELVSETVCECCGRPGEVTAREGWLQARCPEHVGWQQTGIEPRESGEEYIRMYVHTVTQLMSFFIFNANSVLWVQQPSVALGGKRPYEVLGTTVGCMEVVTLIQRLKFGVGI